MAGDNELDPFFKRSNEKRALFENRFRPLPMRRRDRLQWETYMHRRLIGLTVCLTTVLAALLLALGLRRIQGKKVHHKS